MPPHPPPPIRIKKKLSTFLSSMLTPCQDPGAAQAAFCYSEVLAVVSSPPSQSHMEKLCQVFHSHHMTLVDLGTRHETTCIITWYFTLAPFRLRSGLIFICIQKKVFDCRSNLCGANYSRSCNSFSPFFNSHISSVGLPESIHVTTALIIHT